MFKLLWHFMRQELTGQGKALETSLFFVLVLVLGSFTRTAHDLPIMQPLLFSSVWLAVHVAFQPVFQADFQEGRLDRFMLSTHPFSALIAVRLVAVYATSILPASLLAGGLYAYTTPHAGAVIAAYVATGLGVSAVASMAASLLTNSRKSFAMATLLVLPLSAPIVLFGAGVWSAIDLNLPYQTPLGLGLSLAVLTTTAAPFVCAAVLKMKLGS